MKKKLITGIVTVALAIGLLAGCGKNDSNSGNDSSAAENKAESSETQSEPLQAEIAETTGEDVTIKVAIWDYSNTEYYKTIFDAFRAEYPNISIEVVEFSSDEYDTVITTQLGGHQDFDVVFTKGTPSLAALINQGHVYALDDLLAEDENFNADSYAGLVDALSLNGHTFALPFRYDNNLLFYNKTLFDNAGVDYPKDGMSMEEYHALAERMTSGEGNDKVYGALVAQWMGNIYMYAARTEDFVFDDPSTYEALIPYYNEILAMQDDGVIFDYGMLTSSNLHYTGLFYNQQMAMVQMGTWFVNNLFENVKDFEWGVCSMPNNDGMGNENCVGGVTPVSIGAYAKHPTEAWQFIKYVCGEEGAKVLASCGIIPAYSLGAVGEIFDSAPETYAGAPENLSKYISCEKKVIEQPMNEKGNEIYTIMEEENSAIMTKSITPEEGVQNMIDRVTAILEE